MLDGWQLVEKVQKQDLSQEPAAISLFLSRTTMPLILWYDRWIHWWIAVWIPGGDLSIDASFSIVSAWRLASGFVG